MKKILFLVFAAVALAACSKDDNYQPDCPQEHLSIISFETAEGLKDIDGKPVVLGDITVNGGSAAGTHSNVFWAKGGSYTDPDAAIARYNGHLFSTAGGQVQFGSYFSASEYGDYWGGFVLTGNYDKMTTKFDYAKQFTVWADGGIDGGSASLLGYYDGFTGGYADPMVEFIIPM